MHRARDHRVHFVPCGLFAAALTPGILAPGVAAAPPDEVTLVGIVHDLQRMHPDFEVTPIGGLGHFAGNVGLHLDGDERPPFLGTGFRVDTQWRDADTRPIAPHLYAGVAGTDTMRLVNSPEIIDASTVDTYSSALGPYGGSNTGPAPACDLGATMPPVAAPAGMPPRVDEWLFDGGSTTISSDLNCGKFLVRDDATVNISGHVRILVHEEFKVENESKVRMLSGATLELYYRKDATVQDEGELHDDSASPHRVTIVNLGDQAFIVQNRSMVCATLISPEGILRVENQSNFYGRVTGRSISVKNQAGLHFDTGGGGGVDACGNILADLPGAAGTPSTGGITDATTFRQWFTEVPGVNQSTAHAIKLVDDGTGVYEYLDDAFYPIDGRLLGNQYMPHNAYFTYRIKGEFVYESCADQFFEFRGQDDAWLYIDGALVLDLGGMKVDIDQIIHLDRLGLTDGERYDWHLFFANRNGSESVFRLRTNALLSTEGVVPAVSAQFD